MTEGDSPELYKPPQKKEKPLFTKKGWMKMAKERTEITPETDPQDAFRLISQFDESRNPYLTQEEREKKKLTRELRNERIRREGLNSADWAFYTSIQPLGYGQGNRTLGEEDMKRWSAKLPQGLELFITQGAISHGSEYIKNDPFKMIDHFWEVYVRVRPNELEEGQKAIDPPTSTS